ncbi:MAG: TIGR02217 family protein [Alphaproteobacteria bacterium]|nr:MAG: TIGR02217 family protein [Alphaproteobacteria bacterium]
MYWLASAADQRERAFIKRFNPMYWTVNFPRPMMGSVIDTAADALSVKCIFYKHDDLAGLIWESVDNYDHPLLAYETVNDYSGVILSFRWQSTNIRGLDEINGPTLTIEGRDAQGAPKTWFVRLWNYANGAPDDAVITLDFDDLEGGFTLPQDSDPVWPGDIDRIFISLVPPDYDPNNPGPIEPSPGVYTPVAGELTITDLVIDGPNSTLAIGDAFVVPHGLAMANGYDDTFNVTPARVMRNTVQLGYRDWIDHYVGMSHYYTLAWDPGEGRFIVDPAAGLNPVAAAWHTDFFTRAQTFGFKVVISLSYELLDANAPSDWKQRDHAGNPALTGWSPPSTLIAPTNTAALAYLRDIFLELAAIQNGLGADIIAQIGEPWWWYNFTANDEPCFYDDTTTALYTSETGNPVPTKHLNIHETPTSAQQDYLDWLGGKLGASTLWLRDQIKASYPGSDVTLLLFTPQVLNPAAPMLKDVNFPATDWVFPAFDFLQVEDYDHVVAGDWSAHAAGLAAVEAELGYGPADSHYFSGFNLLPETPQVWANIDRAVGDARARGFAETFVWAYPQVVRDGFVYTPDQEDEMSGFHEVQFPPAISFGSTGGPGFMTTVAEAASGWEQRNIEWQQARARYDVGTGLKSENDLADLIAFFRARYGRAYGFRFKDWTDFKSCGPDATPAATDQVIGTGDGATTVYQLVKTYASGAETFTRTIAKPVAGTVTVALDGVVQASGWSVDTTTGMVTFDTAPGANVVITAGFEFDVPVRFAEDRLGVSLETFRAGAAPAIPLIEVRV